MTKRSAKKKAFPGVWTNTVCGHPGVGEDIVDAAKRRLHDELGLVSNDIKLVSPYQYRFTDANGIVENEICPIFVGHTNTDPKPHDHEVDEWKWIDWKEFLEDIKNNSEIYSPWSRKEAIILQRINPELQ